MLAIATYGVRMRHFHLAVFDLDGTLLDSDTALVDAFVQLGIPRAEISFGHPIEVECIRLGLRVEDYVSAYDTDAVRPFEGADQLVRALGRWGICSNKARSSANDELTRLGWSPDVALFADDFGGGPKDLGPVLAALGVGGVGDDLRLGDDVVDHRNHRRGVVYVGDTLHDLHCAEAVGVSFAWAGWNRRVIELDPDGLVLRHPLDLLDLLDR